MVFKKSIL